MKTSIRSLLLVCIVSVNLLTLPAFAYTPLLPYFTPEALRNPAGNWALGFMIGGHIVREQELAAAQQQQAAALPANTEDSSSEDEESEYQDEPALQLAAPLAEELPLRIRFTRVVKTKRSKRQCKFYRRGDRQKGKSCLFQHNP